MIVPYSQVSTDIRAICCDTGAIAPIDDWVGMDDATKTGTVGHSATKDIAFTARQRRRSLGLTQDELADLAGCSPRFIRELETSKPTVRLDKVIDVLTALGLELTVERRTTP